MGLVKCRRGFTVELPCNWVNSGFCGVDGRKCRIVRVVR